jgi:lipopolysaccharide transport system permease protein
MPASARAADRSLAVPSMVVPRWVYARDVLRVLIAREMTLRYRGSVFGMAWTLLNPIAELAVLYFIFGAVLPLNVDNYAAFLFTGLLVNTWFQSSLVFATVSVVNNRELIRRPDVPLAVLPVVCVSSTLLHLLLSLPVLFALLTWTGVPLRPSIMALPGLVVVQFVFNLALAYPLAALHVWFRDTQYLLRVALQLLFFLTPVFYEVRTIPDRFQALYSFNPMVYVIDGYRDALILGRWPDLTTWAVLLSASALTLGLTYGLFTGASRHFVDEL